MAEHEGKFNPELCQFDDQEQLDMASLLAKLEQGVSVLAGVWTELHMGLWAVRRWLDAAQKKGGTHEAP